MRNSLAPLLMATALLVVGAVVSGQTAPYVPGGGYGGYGSSDYGHSHASTYEEGVQSGFADVVRSAGAANLMNSAAAKNYEDARKKYIENRLQATQTYFESRRINQESRDAERSRPLSTEQYVRLARQQAPERLSVSQLDPLSGIITWPASLRSAEYKQDRATIERLYQERARGVDANYQDIQFACEALQAKLQADVAKFDPNDFIRAKKFVESLTYEVKVAQR